MGAGIESMSTFRIYNREDFEVFTRTQEDCIELLKMMRWGNKPFCPKCGESDHRYKKSRDIYVCLGSDRERCNGKKHYEYKVTTGTIFENSNIPLPMWFTIILDFCGRRNAHQIMKERELNYRTIWLAMKKICDSLAPLNERKLVGTVQMDEVFVGPKKFDDLRLGWRIAQYNKQMKLAAQEAKERGEKFEMIPFGHEKVFMVAIDEIGTVIVRIMGSSKKYITKNSILKFIDTCIEKGSRIHMDEHPVHKSLPAEELNIKYVEHNGKKELKDEDGNPILNEKGKPKTRHLKNFITKDGIHTNAGENVNGLLKEFMRQYRGVSWKYLELFVNEFVFHRQTCNMTQMEKVKVLLSMMEKNITLEKLMEMKSEFSRDITSERKKKSMSHSRKKKHNPVEFFDLFGRMAS